MHRYVKLFDVSSLVHTPYVSYVRKESMNLCIMFPRNNVSIMQKRTKPLNKICYEVWVILKTCLTFLNLRRTKNMFSSCSEPQKPGSED